MATPPKAPNWSEGRKSSPTGRPLNSAGAGRQRHLRLFRLQISAEKAEWDSFNCPGLFAPVGLAGSVLALWWPGLAVPQYEHIQAHFGDWSDKEKTRRHLREMAKKIEETGRGSPSRATNTHVTARMCTEATLAEVRSQCPGLNGPNGFSGSGLLGSKLELLWA